ncbi:MAG: hypothetical protein K2N94_07300 [Lachnospiraceae bacterium]|nr:hypothetical protein [Lachnospiraceae bacterium]
MSINKFPAGFEKLREQARELLSSDPSAEQAVAVLTSGERIFCFANHDVTSGSTADEAAFVRTLAESGDTEIRAAVCMWSDSALDVPSHHLRKLLADLNPSNLEAGFLLNGGECSIVKPLKILLSPGR